MHSRTPRPINLLVLAAAFEGGLGLAAWALGWLTGYPAAATLRWQPAALSYGVLASLPLVVALWAMVRFPLGPLATLNRVLDEVILPLFAACGPRDFAVISLLAGLGEELMFRGALQGALSHWLSPAAGLILASALFGLAHPITLAYGAMAAIFGVYLGAVWMASGNLLVPITAHAVYDFVALAYLMARFRRRENITQ